LPVENQQAVALTKTLRTPEHIYLCQRLRQVRIDAGLTQADLAQRLGKPQSYVAKVETQERRLDVVEFVRWAVSCGNANDAEETCRAMAEMLMRQK
jgi:transcriptional regulator with XRE-family HTH domain